MVSPSERPNTTDEANLHPENIQGYAVQVVRKMPPLSHELYEEYPTMSAQTHEAEIQAYVRAALAQTEGHSSPVAGDVGVKTLEWVEEDPGEYTAETPAGGYTCYGDPDEEMAAFPWVCAGPDEIMGHFSTVEEAKATAEADHKQRILSCLAPASQPAAEPPAEDIKIVPRHPTDEQVSEILHDINRKRRDADELTAFDVRDVVNTLFYVTAKTIPAASQPAWPPEEWKARVLGAIEDFGGMKPEDDEDWESWFPAAFAMLGEKVEKILRAAPSAPVAAGYNDGVRAAVRFVEKRRDDYVQEHGSYDPSTGQIEFPGNGDETVGEWEEIIEGIAALSTAGITDSSQEGGR